MSVLESEAFQSKANEYFGDQKVGAVLAEASEIVGSGWQYPPFFEWARSIYGDIASPFYTTGKGSLARSSNSGGSAASSTATSRASRWTSASAE